MSVVFPSLTVSTHRALRVSQHVGRVQLVAATVTAPYGMDNVPAQGHVYWKQETLRASRL
jgi:hypothetical protein